MRIERFSLAAGLLLTIAGTAGAQGFRDDPAWVKSKPAVGDALPDCTVYTPDGKEVKTSGLRGHYTVLAFGCLT
jgi:hypothetical protein